MNRDKIMDISLMGFFYWAPYIFQILTDRHSIQMKNTKQYNCKNIYLKNTKGGFPARFISWGPSWDWSSWIDARIISLPAHKSCKLNGVKWIPIRGSALIGPFTVKGRWSIQYFPILCNSVKHISLDYTFGYPLPNPVKDVDGK